MPEMPPAGASHPTGDNALPPSHARLSPEERSELEKLDTAVGRMKSYTRPDPYLVSISQDRQSQYQYQYRSQQWQWLHNAPFTPEEGEGIQYQTFTYEEPGTNLLSRHAHHYPEERPRTADSTRNGTGSNTPAQGPKKVISFGAYKKQKTGETPTRENAGSQDADKAGKQPAVKGPAERIKAMEAESADMIKAVEEDEKVESIRKSQSEKLSVGKEQPLSKQAELKRKREEASAVKDKGPEVNGHISSSPSKRTRTEPSNSLDKEAKRPLSPLRMPVKKQSPPNAEEKEAYMPPKLSPLHDQSQSADTFQLPPRLSPDLPDDFHLPPRISPDLPANIRATLDRDRRKVGRKEEHISIPSKEVRHVQKPEDEPSDGGKNHPRRSNPPPRLRSPKPTGDQVASNATDDSKATQVRIEERRPREGVERASLVAKIKFKKARKEDVQRILKLPAKPNQSLASPPSAPSSPERIDTVNPDDRKASKVVEKPDSTRRSGKGVAQKIGPASKKPQSTQNEPDIMSTAEANADSSKAPDAVSKKRRADDFAQESPPKKRQASSAGSEHAAKKKTASSLDSKRLPSTPSGREIASPALSSGKKGQLVSPVASRDRTHTRRDTSADIQSETPSAQPHNTTDHLPTSQANGTISAAPTNRASSGKTATPQEWEAEQKRLEKIGREIKHAATALLNDNPNTAAREAAAAKFVESLICYLVAFTCSDRAAEAAGNKPALTPWRTLTPFYQFVARTTASVPVLSGLASSLAVAFHAHILYIVSQMTDGGPSRDSLLKFHAGMLRAAKNADENLDFDVLTESFPQSWRGRAKTSSAACVDEPSEPNKLLNGGYRLPFGMQTSPLLAARAAWAVLREWIANEGLEYEFKIGT